MTTIKNLFWLAWMMFKLAMAIGTCLLAMAATLMAAVAIILPLALMPVKLVATWRRRRFEKRVEQALAELSKPEVAKPAEVLDAA